MREKIPEFRVRRGVTKRQLYQAGFTNEKDHWTYQQFLYDKFIFVEILISKEDFFCTSKILRSDTGGFYSAFYNTRFGPRNLIVEKVTERYCRLLRRLNRAGVVEFIGGEK